MDSLRQRQLNGSERKSIVSAVEIIPCEARNDVKVNMKDILPPVRFVVLTHRHAMSAEHRFHGRRGTRKGRHEWTRQNDVDLVELCDMTNRNDEHVAAIARLLTKAWEHRCVLVNEC